MSHATDYRAPKTKDDDKRTALRDVWRELRGDDGQRVTAKQLAACIKVVVAWDVDLTGAIDKREPVAERVVQLRALIEVVLTSLGYWSSIGFYSAVQREHARAIRLVQRRGIPWAEARRCAAQMGRVDGLASRVPNWVADGWLDTRVELWGGKPYDIGKRGSVRHDLKWSAVWAGGGNGIGDMEYRAREVFEGWWRGGLYARAS